IPRPRPPPPRTAEAANSNWTPQWRRRSPLSSPADCSVMRARPSSWPTWEPPLLLASCHRNTRRRNLLLQVLVIPRQIPFQPVPLVARPLDSVVLVGIDDELRIDSQAPQRLVHLLAALHRNVEVPLAAEEQRGRLDPVRVQERIRDLHVRVEVLPRRPD